jgi:hypothetical protein
MHLLGDLSWQLRPEQRVHELPGRQQPGPIVPSNSARQCHTLSSGRRVHGGGGLSKLYRHDRRAGQLSVAYANGITIGDGYTVTNGNGYCYCYRDVYAYGNGNGDGNGNCDCDCGAEVYTDAQAASHARPTAIRLQRLVV